MINPLSMLSHMIHPRQKKKTENSVINMISTMVSHMINPLPRISEKSVPYSILV